MPIKDTDLEDLFSNKLKNAKILVVGDLILDQYIFGTSDRLSPESPVPVLNVENETYRLGGAANVVANLAGLGVVPYIAGLVGDDTEAIRLTEMIEKLVRNKKGLIQAPMRPTTLKTRFLANHQQMLRVDRETSRPISVAHTEKILEYVHSILASLDLIILSDYGKGTFNEALAGEIIRDARKNNIPVIVDPKGKNFTRYKNANIVTPNIKELAMALDIDPPTTEKGIINAAKSLASKNNFEAVLVTRSQDGMSLVPSDTNSFGLDHTYHYQSRVIDVFDVSGAGDTAVATLGACLASGIILTEAVQISNTASGIVVQKVGTASIQNQELKAALKSFGGPLRQSIYPAENWSGAQQTVEHWKSQGLTVGFTNGCFDVLHAGHVSYLNETHQKCDKLVVGLNCDESVTRLKGSSRPVNPSKDRAAVLAALKAVDMVVLFAKTEEEEDKAIKLINTLKPDIYFKGGDYSEDKIPEAPTVRSYGGDVYICKPVEGLSTSVMLEKLSKENAA